MRKILILDDQPIVLELLKFSLEQQIDAEVIPVDNIESAISKIENNDIDLLITDYNIVPYGSENKTSGLELVNFIENQKIDLPVIMFSGEINFSKTINNLGSNIVAYINKNDEDFIEDLITSCKDTLKAKEIKKKIVKSEEKSNLHFKNIIYILLVIVLVLVLTILI